MFVIVTEYGVHLYRAANDINTHTHTHTQDFIVR
jgi:hypothetical protein